MLVLGVMQTKRAITPRSLLLDGGGDVLTRFLSSGNRFRGSRYGGEVAEVANSLAVPPGCGRIADQGASRGRKQMVGD